MPPDNRPIPENVATIHMNFQLPGGEVAVMGLHAQLSHGAGNDLNWPTVTTKLAEIVATKWKTQMTPVAGNFPYSTLLRDVTTYHLAAANGHTLDKGQFVPTGAQIWQGQDGVALPSEVALAVTLYGFDPTKFDPDRRRKRGRMYLPPVGASVLAPGADGYAKSGRLSVASQTGLKTALGNFINDLHGAAADGSSSVLGGDDRWFLGVLSRKYNAFNRLQSIGLGDVFDVQTRRRRQLLESYQTVAIGPD